MLLKPLERLMLVMGGVMPATGNFSNLKLIREANEAFAFNPEEEARLAFTTPEGGGIRWADKVLVYSETGDLIRPLMTKDDLEAAEAEVAAGPEPMAIDEACPVKEIEIEDVVFKLIVKSLRKMDKEEKLTADHYSLCEKFFEEDAEKITH